MKRIPMEIIKMMVLIFLFSGIVLSETEIISKRTFNTKTYQVNTNEYRKEIYLQPIHYLDDNGNYVDIPLGTSETDSLTQLARNQSVDVHTGVTGTVATCQLGPSQGNTLPENGVSPVIGYSNLNFTMYNFPIGSWLSRGYLYFPLDEIQSIYNEYSSFLITQAGFELTSMYMVGWDQNTEVTLLPYINDVIFYGYGTGNAIYIWDLVFNSPVIGYVPSNGNGGPQHLPNDGNNPNLIDSIDMAINSGANYIGIGLYAQDESTILNDLHYAYYETWEQYFYIIYQVTEVKMKNISGNTNLGGALSLTNQTTGIETVVNSLDLTPIPINFDDYYSARTFDPILSFKKHYSWNSQSNYLLLWDNFQMQNSYIEYDMSPLQKRFFIIV